jgi:serpin B
MNKLNPRRPALRIAALACAGWLVWMLGPTIAGAQATAPVPVKKDVVVDAPAAAASGASAAVPAGVAVAAPFELKDKAPANVTPAAQRREIFGAALADVGLQLLRQSAKADGSALANRVASPYGIAATLGMLHAGAAGETAAELAAVLEARGAGGRLMTASLRDLTVAVKGDESSRWISANRVWVGAGQAKALAPAFVKVLKDDFKSDGALVDFNGKPEQARETINQWVQESTGKLIPEVLGPGAVKPSTKLVLTNANYFRGAWATPFEKAETRDEVFFGEKEQRKVPTMHQTLAVREALVDNVYVLELPFDGGAFSLLLAMPPRGHTIQALESDLQGADVAAWIASTKPTRVTLSLPRFEVKPAAVSLNDTMASLGITQAFSEQADFSGILGTRDLKLDGIFHSAAIKVDESGTVAASATAAVVASKSMSLPGPQRSFNRPFLFVLVHKPTGTPLFMGRVAMP